MTMAIRMRRTFSWLIIWWWWWWQWCWQCNMVDGADYWKECICGSATQWVFWKEHTRAGNSMRWHFAEEKIMERLRNGFFFNFLRKHGVWVVWKQHDVAFWKCNLREEARIKLDNLVPMLSLPRRSHPSPPPRIENLRISISSGPGKTLNSTSDHLLERRTMNTLKSEFLEEFTRLGPWASLSWVKEIGWQLKKS